MANRCALCNKGRQIGRSHRHHRGVAGGQWKQRAQKTIKISKPNLHPFKGILQGKKGIYRLCTKCLRRVKEANLSK